VSAGDNQLWVGTDGGVVRWDGTKLTNAGLSSLDHIQALAMIVDRDSNLWIGTNSQGLLRFNAQGVATREAPNAGANYAITALFEDREGDLWVGSESGLERIRDSAFVTFSLPEGLPADGAKPVFMDSGNRLWFGPAEGGLWQTKQGRHGTVSSDGLDRDVVYSIAGGEAGELWVGRQHGGLTRLSFSQGSTSQASVFQVPTTAHTYTERDGLAQNSVFSVFQARDGAVWAGTLSGGASRFKDGHFTNYSTANGLVSDTVNAMEESSDGVLWFATPEGLSSFSQGRWRSWKVAEGLPAAAVNCLLEDKAGVLWAGTAAGLAFRSPRNFQVPAGLPALLREEILGMAEDRFGSLWITTSGHVLRVNRLKLLAGALAEEDIQQFGLTDGLRGVEGVKRNRSVVTDSMGRVWLSLNRGISVMDPARLRNNSVPVIPHVQTILVDGKPLGLTGANPAGAIHIPSGRNRLTFDYAGLSLSIPERVRFRYQLEGFDHGWSEPVATREAVYTSLPPGPYRFRLIASNPDGVWSSGEADAGFEVDPVFWQTWRFQTAVVLGCFAVGIMLYRFRLHQMTGQLNVRFEERLAERTRIAQELHDTLLQGFLSASMQVHVVADQLPVDSAAKPLLTRAQQLMGQVIEEGRNAVRGLRSSKTASLDLEQAFSLIRQELLPQTRENEQIGFRVIVEGDRRPLRPLLRDEVYRIGREALLNAFRHARATSIDVELRYSHRDLRMVVRDDGCGIDPHIVDSGREGHWGLSGMRERADRIGARFHVWSGATGTEIEVSIPGQIAFQDHRNRGLAWFGKNFRNGAGK
jgi:streptogramin lyase